METTNSPTEPSPSQEEATPSQEEDAPLPQEPSAAPVAAASAAPPAQEAAEESPLPQEDAPLPQETPEATASATSAPTAPPAQEEEHEEAPPTQEATEKAPLPQEVAPLPQETPEVPASAAPVPTAPPAQEEEHEEAPPTQEATEKVPPPQEVAPRPQETPEVPASAAPSSTAPPSQQQQEKEAPPAQEETEEAISQEEAPPQETSEAPVPAKAAPPSKEKEEPHPQEAPAAPASAPVPAAPVPAPAEPAQEKPIMSSSKTAPTTSSTSPPLVAVDTRAAPERRSVPSREKSLQWHDAPQTSTREIVSPQKRSLPAGPSMMQPKEVVAVFNANTDEGGSMVRALHKSGYKVVAIVRVFTSRNTKALLKLGKNVVVKVADSHDQAALSKAVEGAHRAFLVTSYWERFDSNLEEKQAMMIINACASKGVHHLVLSSFEDTRYLKEKGLKSQIVPRRDGTIEPKFEGMMALKELAREENVMLTHMITSYLDQENSKKSLCLIVGENGNLIVQPHVSADE